MPQIARMIQRSTWNCFSTRVEQFLELGCLALALGDAARIGDQQLT